MSPVLVDTSVWIAHLRKGEAGLVKLLEEEVVLCHPFIIGELACGNLKNRQEILSLLQSLPQTPQAENDEALHFIERNGLMGKGLGWVDVHLLASALLVEARLWTLDKALQKASQEMKISFR
jgi:predicted nucleic acid-binding protein